MQLLPSVPLGSPSPDKQAKLCPWLNRRALPSSSQGMCQGQFSPQGLIAGDSLPCTETWQCRQGAGSTELPGGTLGKSWLWQQRGERGGCAWQGAQHLPLQAQPGRLYLCRGETEAAQVSKSSQWCQWHSAHLCCAHIGLCALGGSWTKPGRFLTEQSHGGMWDLPLPRVLHPCSVGNHNRKCLCWVCHHRCHTAPVLQPQPHWWLHRPARCQLQTCCGCCCTLQLLLLIAGDEQDWGRQQGLGSALPWLLGLQHLTVLGSTCRPHTGTPSIPYTGSTPCMGIIPCTRSIPHMGNSPVPLNSPDLLCPMALAASCPSPSGRKVSLAQTRMPEAGARL